MGTILLDLSPLPTCLCHNTLIKNYVPAFTTITNPLHTSLYHTYLLHWNTCLYHLFQRNTCFYHNTLSNAYSTLPQKLIQQSYLLPPKSLIKRITCLYNETLSWQYISESTVQYQCTLSHHITCLRLNTLAQYSFWT